MPESPTSESSSTPPPTATLPAQPQQVTGPVPPVPPPAPRSAAAPGPDGPPAGATAAGAAPGGSTPEAAAPGGAASAGAPAGEAPAAPDGHQPTAPVRRRPRIGPLRRSPLTRMGPWAPVAGALAGLAAGLVVVLLLAGVAEVFAARLSLVFVAVGLSLLGAAAVLLADEIRLLRRAGEIPVRPSSVEATAGLLNGLTPARLLLAAAAFVLFLAAYVA